MADRSRPDAGDMAEPGSAGGARTGFEVAIVGMAGRFPGADDVQAFWRNLRAGEEAITFFTRDELVAAGTDPALADLPDFVPAMGELRAADEVDAVLFGLTPRDAEVLDPQHRLLLECAWSALEHAGYDPARGDRQIGVFAGSGTSAYVRHLQASAELVEGVGLMRIGLWNEKDQLAAGVSYRLNLRGPSLAVQTACSTSLVAVHLACQSLVTGECDLALAGGVSAQVPLRRGYLYTPDGIGSPDGHCRAFDAGSLGTVGGCGVGLVALRRLDDALADGDTIHAVIRGSAVNNDGAQKVGYTAPSVAGQARVISEALAVAGVDAASLQYLEAHGSGTPLGDAIELKALGEVLGRGGAGHGCAIGSVKSSVGHLDTAAGIAGLIKTVLALEHGEIPASLHCAVPHPEIEAMGGRVFVNTALRPWARNGGPRRAGVSSFGIGGTNAHVVLEEAPARGPSGPSRARQLLVLSAKTATAAAAAAENLAAHLEREPTPLADAAYTLQTGRRELEHRLAVVCGDAVEAAAGLRAAAARGTRPVQRTERPVAFLFPGLGMHHVDMGRGLYDAEPVFRAAVDECCERLRPVLGADLREGLYSPAVPPPGSSAGGGEPHGGWDLRRLLGRAGGGEAGGESPLDETALAQPAVFVTEYALTKLLASWGVRPRGLLGHSLGEYVAACVAGVLSLDDALRLVALRARLIDGLPAGAMLAVPLGEAALREILPPALDVAAVNTPESCVVAGTAEAIDAFEALLAARGAVSRRLAARHAFHSRAMRPVAAELERVVGGFTLRAPEIPFISTMTGTWITDDEARSPAYWARHLTRTVRFADGVATLRQDPGWALLEVGPGQTLGAWALQHPAVGTPDDRAVHSSLRHPHHRVDDLHFLLESLGGLWAAGVEVDWAAFGGGERRHRVPLPGYPFERKRFWVGPPPRADAGAAKDRPAGRAMDSGNAATEPNEMKGPDVMDNQTAAQANRTAPSPRHEAVLGRLRGIASELTGIEARHVASDLDLFRVGFDSLLLLQGIQAIEKQMGVRLSLVVVLEELTTLDALAKYIDEVLPPDAVVQNGTHAAEPAPAPAAAPVALPAAVAEAPRIPAPPAFYPLPAAPAAGGGGGALEQVVALQLHAMSQLMAQQLAAFGHAVPVAPAPTAPAAGAPAAPAPAPVPAPSFHVPQSPRAKIQPDTPFVAYQPVNTEAGGMTAREKTYLDGFIERYVARTPASKAHQARYHQPLADSRVTARFRRAWKEMIYPIVGKRALGSRVWDLDGNEYVDTAMAFGCSLFGHAPEFVSRAIREQVEAGYGVGPQSPHAGRAAELICELGGNDRAIFCNSGTEAVMGAIRAARTYTGRTKVAYFAGSYHGWSDVVQGRVLPTGDGRVRPTAPGIPGVALEDVVILPYDQPESLERLAPLLKDVAVVMVEPVQSRRPDIQPRAFLHELRRITRDAGTLLHFDELITGFRILPGGAQAYFGVDADLVTYGKVIAGGLPMGVVAGKSDPMSVFDGGVWRYGDDSYPPAQRTLFAGAFFKHPLSMAVTCALMEEVRRQGAPMYDRLNETSARLVARMNGFFEAERFPVTAVHFGSMYRFFFGPEVRSNDLFNHHLIHEGIHVIPETGTHFLSTAHGDEDVERVFAAVCASAVAMRRGGFIPAPAGPPAPSPSPSPSPAPVAGTREDGVRVLPVSEGQRQLWIESQMGDAASLAYVESTSFRLRGALDVAALRAALQDLVDRHDTLRTTFGPDGDVQLVHPALAVDVPLEDLRGAPPEAREARLAAWVRDRVRRPFDLARGPLVRFALAALGEDEHLLLFDAHHAVLDGWSSGILFEDLGALYLARKEGRAPALPPRPDHAALVRAQIDALREDPAAGAYWSAQFADGAPVLELPADRPRPPTRGYRGERVTRVVDGALMDRLAAAGREHGLSLFHTFLSACFVWLGRLSGQDDVVVGTPSAGQAGRAGAAELVGYGISVLPVRARMEGSARFVEHARRVRRAVVGALEHQNFSLPALVERLQPVRDPSRPPLFQAAMYLDRGAEEATLGDLRAGVESNFGGGARVELGLGVIELPNALRLDCDFSADLFDRETVERWLAHFERLLEGIAADPEARLGALEMVGPGERRRLLEEWNRTDAPIPAGTVHARVEAHAARAPGAPAVEAGGEVLGYGELNARANRLAHHLARLGVGPEARVGLCLERGAELIVAMLAVLKAGGAYLPLDPAAPAERRAFMLADAGASVLVTRDALRSAGAEPSGVRVLSLDAAAGAVAAEPAENPAGRATARSLAYVVYTSGSTGTPKGVAVEHGGLANLCAWYAKDLEITAADRVSQLISAGFDASVLEIWPPLAQGARVQVVPDAVRADPDALRDWFLRQGTTLAHCPPPLAGPLLALDWPRAGSPRRMVTGGERLQVAPGPEIPFPLTVGYGATETTVAVTAGRAETAAERLGSIGRPGDNSRAYVLDGALRPEPVGVAGELCLGGAQVARGYLGRPALTAERFTPDPFGPVPGARLYRTGDRARWRADGTLEFVGRLDGQVKIRGFRVEPGEVEVALRRHPGVSACAVVAREDVPGDRRLAAYVVGGASGPELRAHLRRTLPEHMIPSAFVALEALPQTASDKLDREALPAPDHARADREHVAPRGATEETLASIWAEVLRIDRVGVEDGFFTLGGDSILAIRVAARARKAGMEVTPRALFEHPTIAALAAALAAPSAAGAGADPAVGGAAGPPAPRGHTPADFPLARLSESELEAALAGAGAVEDLYPLTPLQEGLLYHSLQGAGHQAYQIQLALRLEGELDGDRFRRAWSRLVDRHAPLRTDFAWRDLARPLQRVRPAVELPWVQEDWSARSDAEQEAALERFLEADHARGFALDEAPLLRFALFRVGDRAHWFAWSLHHLLADGWSTSRIMDEVFRLYRADAGAEAAGLAPVRPYRDFVAWLADQDRDAAERHWRGVLAGFAAPTRLGVDRPPVPGAAPRHASRRTALPVEETRRLSEAARRHGVTLNTLLLGAWGVLLARYSGEEDVVFGTTVSGRPAELEGVEEMVGLFINTLPVRVRLPGEARVGDWLRALQGDQAESRAYEHAPLVDVQAWSEVPGGTALFETLVVVGNHPVEAGAAGGGADGPRVAGGRSVDWSTFPLCLSATPGRRLLLDLACDEGRVDAETAARMLDHLARVLRQLAGDGSARLSGLALAGEEERRRVLEAWNRTARDFPRDACIHDLIAAQAARTPGAPAVVHDGGTLTCAELHVATNRLARHLRGLGVRPETRVAICVERGPDTAVAILGVLKAGGAYVPLDPAYPDDHLAWMLGDSGAAVLLTHAALAGRFPAAGVRVVALDDDRARIAAEDASAPGSGAVPGNLAYVIYTSGSTGRPKGVALAHRALVNFAVDTAARLELGPGDRVLQFASPGFDVVVEEIFPAWVAGAAVVFTRGNRCSPAELLDEVERHGITAFELPTAYWQEWVHALVQDGRRLPACVRLVMTGGERVAPEGLEGWSTLGVPLAHVFGLTETACNSAMLRLEAGDGGARWPNLPIGTPTGNVRLYALDRGLSPAPVGVPGELFIGGEGLARGYLGRPGLTAARFVPDPFSAEPGARLYRTGDRVRWLADGNLEFLGRLDHQVKLRGFRIEPGEVEAALQALPGVREARVVVRRDPPGEPRLVAYVVGDADPAGLRAALRGTLPEHLVPAAVVALDRLPLTPNGKLDRRALPAPGYPGGASEFDEPRDYLETRIIHLWEQVLGIGGIGATQSFFDLGGNSLQALRLFTRVNRALDCDLPLATLLAGATVREMADAVREQKRAPRGPAASVVPLQPGGSLPPLFLVHSADRDVSGYVSLVRHLGPGQPAYGIRDVGEDRGRPIERIAAEHLAAIRAVQPAGPYYLAGWSFGGLVAFEMGRQLQRRGETAALVGLMDTMANDLHQARPRGSDLELVLTLAGDVAARARRPFHLDPEALSGHGLEEQVRRAAEALHAQGAAPPGFDAGELLEGCRLELDRDRSAAGFAPDPYPGTVTLFRADDVPPPVAEHLARYDDEERRTLGWCRHALEVEVHPVPGSHPTIAREPHARVLAERMREALAAARARAADESHAADAADAAGSPSSVEVLA